MIGLLAGYLSLTTVVADQLTVWFDLPTHTPSTYLSVPTPSATSTEVTHEYIPLGTTYERGGLIPDILLRNSQYQAASVASSQSATSTPPPTDPMEALVNIYCEYETETKRHARTGTGFFISERGVIITNAHVAQFLLLDDIPGGGNSECVVRMGNPAVARYTAELLYISPAWILEHAALIDATEPSGTGERDYALLYVKSSVGTEPAPARFPSLQFTEALLERSATDSEVTVLGFPAEELTAEVARNGLVPKSADTTIAELFTFDSNLADVFSIRGSAVGERGSSGGPVLNEAGQVIGMVSTKGAASDGVGSLRAITFSHINRTIQAETSFQLRELMTGDLAYRAQIFNQTLVPFLSETLTRELSR